MLKQRMNTKKVLTIFVLILLCIYYVLSKSVHQKPNYAIGTFFNVVNKISNEITIIIAVNNLESVVKEYSISIPTIQCYAQAMNYNLYIIDFSNKSSFPSKCNLICNHCPEHLAKSAEVKFSRHCIIAEYLLNNPKTKYVLALDGDIGVINPNHRIEDYIDPRFDLTFHERRYNFEIQAATYIAKNSKFAINFLNSWANKINEIPVTIQNADNPALHQVLMEHQFSDARKYECKALWKFAENYGDILKFVYCTRRFLGFNMPHCCNNKIRIFLANDIKNVSWSRDGWLTKTKFSDNDFMFHDWKTGDLQTPNVRSHWQNPFSPESFQEPTCFLNNTDAQWKYLPEFKTEQKKLNDFLITAQNERRKNAEIDYLKEK